MRWGCGWPRRRRGELLQNFLPVGLQFGDIAPHPLLTGRELACEQVNTLAHRCETERKVLQIG
jgi:hypothetical protein